MTKKDFELIARVLNDTAFIESKYATDGRGGSREMMARTIERMADALGRENPRFDRARFVARATYTGDRSTATVTPAARI